MVEEPGTQTSANLVKLASVCGIVGMLTIIFFILIPVLITIFAGTDPVLQIFLIDTSSRVLVLIGMYFKENPLIY